MNLFSIVLCFFAIGCASGRQVASVSSENETSKTQVVVDNQQPEKQVDDIYLSAAKKLDEFVGKAKSDGPDTMRYMGSDLFIKASDASMRGDFRTSSFLFKYVLDLFPEDNFIKKKYAIDLIRAGDMEIAENILKQVYIAEKGKDETIGLVLAGLYTAQEKGKEARQTYLNILKQHPSSEEACVFLAKSYAVEEKFNQSLSTLENCSQRAKGKKAIFHYYMGKMELSRGNKTRAKELFLAALNTEKSYYQAALGLGLLEEEKENFEKALNIYKNFNENNRDNTIILGRMIQVQFALSKFKDALPNVEHLVSLDSSDLNMRVRLGILYTDAGNYEMAKKTFMDILGEVPDSDKVTFYLAALYHHTEQVDLAIELYNKIAPESTLFHDSILQLTSILQAKALDENATNEDTKKYLEFVQTKSKINEEISFEMNLSVANFHDKKGDLDKAVAALDLLHDNEKYLEKISENGLYQMAAIYERVKRYDDCDKILLHVIKTNPKNAHAMNFLGYSMIERGIKFDEAKKYLEAALKLRPNDGYIIDSLGWYYYRMGQIKNALKHISKAHELVQDDATIKKHLAIVYKDMKRYDEAKKHFSEALKICQDQDEKQEILDSLSIMENSVRLPASEAP